MNFRPIQSQRGRRGFTLLVIAVSLAVIGFAIVAVLGVLPTALNVQRDTRERTVVLQDANYFMEAVRRGAQGTNDLVSYVERMWDVSLQGGSIKSLELASASFPRDQDVLQLLSEANYSSPTNSSDTHLYTVALVRSLSGSAAEKGPNAVGDRIAFKYLIKSEVVPVQSIPEEAMRPLTPLDFREDAQRIQLAQRLNRDLYEFRFTIYWPAIPEDFVLGSTPRNQINFRTYVGGDLSTNNPSGQLHFNPRRYQ